MYAFISGKLVEKNPAYVVINVHGIGYLIHISLNTFSAIGNLEEVKLYTHLAVREDAHLLYGFYSQREKELFLQLITVSGVGANTARMILSSLSTEEAIEAIATGKSNILQSVKGIGTKTAQRIVIDLRDKVGKSDGFTEKSSISYNTIKEEALSGLLVLGFNKVAAEKVLEKIVQLNPAITVEKLIKDALKVL
jgi:Holliday junction DNA helicase RuvA